MGVLPLPQATSTLGMTRGSGSTLGTPSMHGKRVGNGLFLALGLLGCCEDRFCTVFPYLMTGPVLPVFHSDSLIPISGPPPAPLPPAYEN